MVSHDIRWAVAAWPVSVEVKIEPIKRIVDLVLPVVVVVVVVPVAIMAIVIIIVVVVLSMVLAKWLSARGA